MVNIGIGIFKSCWNPKIHIYGETSNSSYAAYLQSLKNKRVG